MKRVQPKPYITSVTPYQPGRPIDEIQQFFSDRKVIKLASNESPIGPSELVQRRLQELLPQLHRYPDGGTINLRAAIAAFTGVDAGQIVAGNGSNELIELLVQAFTGEGSTLYTSEVTFAVYPLAAMVRGAKAVQIPMKEYCYDLQAFHAIPEGGGLVCIADPNNPTGTVCDFEAFVDLVEARPDLFFLYDAAYEEYRERHEPLDWKALVDKHPNLFVIRTFSKAFGLAGLRVGYGFGNEQTADILNRLRQPFNVNAASQIAAIAALEDLDHMNRVVELNRQMRQGIYDWCSARGLFFQPSQTNFVLMSVPSESADATVTAADFWANKLLKEGVIVRSMKGFGLPNHIRVNTGSEEEMEEFFKRFDRLLDMGHK